jgi:diacylglycerol kinase (ATP)
LSEPRPRFSVHSRLRSFAFALSGLRYFAVSEHNAWIHAAATLAVLVLAAILGVDRGDWLWLILAIGWVWMAEAFNTAIERLADQVSLERSEGIRIVKDLAAAGVLISALGASVIGTVVFWPAIQRLLF